jgi:hypothetical protein
MSTPIKPSPQQSMQLGMDNLTLSPAANGAPAAAGAAAAGGKEGGSSAQAALFMSG